jgi:hypothetical protein
VPASGSKVSLALPPHPELVLLCGGNQEQRARLRRTHPAAIECKSAVTTGDVQSLLRWAPRSRAVIVCGELAGIGVATIERLVRACAPDVELISQHEVAGEELTPSAVPLSKRLRRSSERVRRTLRVASG